MKIAAIIAEYNPFHNGHFRQVRILKDRMGYDHVIAIMSPDFVQRGEPALFGMYDRARAAMAGGVDAVFSLPVCLATGSAEYFAEGGVGIAHALGAVDALCFGCETPNVSLLHRIASITNEEPSLFRDRLREKLAEGVPFPAARAEAIRCVLREQSSSGIPAFDVPEEPNNILAVEYVRAILKMNSHLKPLPILREGSAYDDDRLIRSSEETPLLPSAAAIRKAVRERFSKEGDADEPDMKKALDLIRSDLGCAIPPESSDILMNTLSRKEICSTIKYDLLMHFALLQFTGRSSREDITAVTASSVKAGPVQDMTPELALRIAGSMGEFRSTASYAAFLHTKNMTRSRINRALLHVLLDIPQALPDAVRSRVSDGGQVRLPGLYTQLIGFRREASGLIRTLQDQARIPVIVKPASARKLLSGASLRSFETDMYAQEIYNMIRECPVDLTGYRKTVEIL